MVCGKQDIFYFPYYYSQRVTYEKKKFMIFVLFVCLLPIIVYLLSQYL